MRISKSGKLTVSLTCELARPGSGCFQKNLDANPEKSGFCGKSSTPAMFDSSLSHSFLLPQRNCASVGPRGHNPRAVVTGFKIFMRCAREGLCHLAVNWHHKWLFIEKLRRSLARSLASNAALFTNLLFSPLNCVKVE